MVCNQSRPGFELVLPCPFPPTINITPWVPPILNQIDCLVSLFDGISTLVGYLLPKHLHWTTVMVLFNYFLITMGYLALLLRGTDLGKISFFNNRMCRGWQIYTVKFMCYWNCSSLINMVWLQKSITTTNTNNVNNAITITTISFYQKDRKFKLLMNKLVQIQYIFYYLKRDTGGTLSRTDIIIDKWIGDLSSKPGQGCLHFILC